MKKISILSVLALLVFSFPSLHAQIINKGNIILGSTFAFSNSTASFGYSNSNANISPRIGYAVGSNSVLYVRLGAGFSKTHPSTLDATSKYSNLSAGVSWKKFSSVNEKLGWYTDAYAVIGAATSRTTYAPSNPNPSYKSNSTSYSAGINPGIYFMATPRLIISADFGGLGYIYQISKYTGQSDTHSSSFNINLLNYFGFGVDFIIAGKKS